jgi:hypothetical protein
MTGEAIMKKIPILLIALLILCSIGIPNSEGGNGLHFILLDNSDRPKKIGKVVTVTPIAFGIPANPSSPRGVLTRVRFLDSIGKKRFVGLFVENSDFPFLNTVLFTTSNCTGQPYLGAPVLDAEFPNAFEPIAVTPAIDDFGNFDLSKRSVYISKYGESRVGGRTFKSVANVFNSSSCLGISLSPPSVEAEVLVPDLLTTFKPPYRLEVSKIGVR